MSMIFSRIIAIILSILAFFQGGDILAARIIIKKDVPIENPVITYSIENYSGRTIEVTHDFDLYVQTKDGNGWTRVELKNKAYLPDEIITIKNIGIFTDKTNLGYYAENLEVGHYKIEKRINFAGEENFVTVSAEFNIGLIFE